MFGLLGPNGAGKSSLMRTIATLQEPDSGTITLGELDVLADKDAVRRVLGYLPQEFGVYPNVSAETLLDYFAGLKGLRDAAERRAAVENLLQQTNLWAMRKKAVGGYSGGMKQRFGIAVALLGAPQLIIVDEPTAGLDPTERNRFLDLLSEIGENVVVILSTHIVDDVTELCPNMAIIAGGEVVATGSPTDVIGEIRGKVYRTKTEKAALAQLRGEYEVISSKLVAGQPIVRVFSEVPINGEFQPAEATLEDVYFHRLARREQQQVVA
jgi:ABC-type multidrug transport system ATPase subunit